MRRLLASYGGRDDVAFVVVYQREPHAGRMGFADVDQPATYAERVALARRAHDELGLTAPAAVDFMDDASRALFGDLPAPVFVVDPRGVVAAKDPWIDPRRLAAMLEPLTTLPPPAASRPAASRPATRRIADVDDAAARAREIAADAATTPIGKAVRLTRLADDAAGAPVRLVLRRAALAAAEASGRPELRARLLELAAAEASAAGDASFAATCVVEAAALRGGPASRPDSR